MGVVKTLKSIREFFWPLLDPLDEVSIRQITIEDCKFNDDEIDMELKYLEDNKRSEEDRKKEVESKATIFIGRGRKFFCVFKIGSSIQLELDM